MPPFKTAEPQKQSQIWTTLRLIFLTGPAGVDNGSPAEQTDANTGEVHFGPGPHS